MWEMNSVSPLQFSSGPPELVLELFRASCSLVFLCGQLRDRLSFSKLWAGYVPQSLRWLPLAAREQPTMRSTVHKPSSKMHGCCQGWGHPKGCSLCSACPRETFPRGAAGWRNTPADFLSCGGKRRWLERRMECDLLTNLISLGLMALPPGWVRSIKIKRKEETHLWHFLPLQNIRPNTNPLSRIGHTSVWCTTPCKGMIICRLQGNTPEVHKEWCYVW